jgi:hypothetical protein
MLREKSLRETPCHLVMAFVPQQIGFPTGQPLTIK